MSSSIELLNRSGDNILFKIKTTDPTNYIVRPNQGIISPEGSMNIRIQCMLDLKKVRKTWVGDN